MLPGVMPTPPGFNFTEYGFYYDAGRLNNAEGNKAVPDFHLDLAVTALRLDYSLPDPVWGIRLGVYALLPLIRAHLVASSRAGQFDGTETGAGDLSFSPLVAGWEYDTPIGRLNQSGRFAINLPTAGYNATHEINLGRGYTNYTLAQGNSLFPTDNTHIDAQISTTFNEKNPTTNYLSGNELEVDWAAGYDLNRDISIDVNGYLFQQLTNDYQDGVLVDGNGNKGHAIGIGPQLRFKLHPGAITIKWQTEVDVQNRTQGNRFWLQFFHPL